MQAVGGGSGGAGGGLAPIAATAPVGRALTLVAGTSASAGSASATTERTCSERGAGGRAWRGCSAARLLPHCPRAVPRNDMASRALL